MTKTLKSRKSLALALALTLALSSLATSAFATNYTYNNFTKSPATAYNYRLEADSPNQITLQVGPADDSWNFIGFDSETDAANTNVTWSLDSKLSKISQSPVQLASGKWVNQEVIGLAGSNWGYATVTATWTANASSYPMSFTINIDPSTKQAAKTGVVVDIYAPAGSTQTLWHTVTAGAGITATVLADSLSSTALENLVAIRNFSTPLSALVAMKTSSPTASNYKKVISDLNYGIDGSYVSSITAYDTFSPPATFGTQLRAAFGNEGWRYCVYRGSGKTKIDSSDIINANGFALQDNDVVVWRYTDYGYSFPSTYSAYTAAA